MARKLIPNKKTKVTEIHEEMLFAKELDVKSMTNLQLVINIVKGTKNSTDIESMNKVEAELTELGERFKTNKHETFLIAASMEWGKGMTLAGVRNFMECSRMEAMLFEEHFENLVKRRYMKKVGYDEDLFLYELKPCVVHAIQDNKPVKVDKVKVLDNDAFWIDVSEIYQRDEFHLFSGLYELNTLLNEQKNQPLAKICKQEQLSDTSKLLLAYVCARRALMSQACVEKETLRSDDPRGVMAKVFRETVRGTSQLAQKHLLEAATEDGLAIANSVCLTTEAVRDILGEDYEVGKEEFFVKGMVKSSNIPAKELFYNDDEDAVVKKIMRTIDDENFKQIQQRMKENSFRISYPILLFGGPGVGKTELCFQLARLSGRDIIEVKISDLRDKFVGEGQKHVQALFDRYRRVMKSSKKCPILLLNEADGILTKRSEGHDTPAAKEENAMQNIFLREFEKFEGILIATTNLQSNFDPAFERRFLLKLKLSSPNEKARTQIWKSLAKGLSDADAAKLGKEFAMSGGQIENCARRQMIEYLLEGAEVNYDTLSKLAAEELGYKKTNHATVGFKIA